MGNNFTEIEIINQFLEKHWTDILKFYGAKMKNATEVENMAFDEDKVIGILCSYVYEGVRKVVNVTPLSLVEGLSGLSSELALRCERAAESAEELGSYAERQGDRLSDAILDISEQKELAVRMAAYAEEQGDRIAALKDEMTDWFGATPGDGIRHSVSTWFSSAVDSWLDWFGGVMDDWSVWLTNTKGDWSDWFAGRKAEWTAWFSESIQSVEEATQAAQQAAEAASQVDVVELENRMADLEEEVDGLGDRLQEHLDAPLYPYFEGECLVFPSAPSASPDGDD